MKKNFFKLFSMMLAGISLFSVFSFAGCRDDGGSTDSSSGATDSTGGSSQTVKPQNTYNDTLDRGPLTNVLHNVNVTPSDRVLVTDAGTKKATTDYKIIVDETDAYKMRAGTFIAQHLSEASSASFSVGTLTALKEAGVEMDENAKYIFVGCTEIFKACGLEMPEEDLGPAGYYVKTYGNSVFIEVQGYNGYQLGSIALLKAVVGYDMIAHDTVVYETVGATLPDMEIIERPDYDYRNYTNWMTQDGLYGMGFDYNAIFTAVGEKRLRVHNIFGLLPTEEHLADNPEWYSTNATHRQLCYTARGNQAKYDAMQEAMLEVMVKEVLAQPEQGVITVTQEDAPVCCDCEECTRVLEEDGSISATIIRFLNDLDVKFQKALEDYAEETGTEKRIVQIAFFAYHTSYAPPSTPVSEDPTLKCSPNITVFIAPLYAKYVHSFYHESNQVYADQVRAWSEYTDNIMAWVYETDYHHYMFPYNTYSSMVDTYYFFKQNGANIMYNEGQRWSENVTCFGKLKEYIDSKAQFDVTISYEYYKDKFFEHYYGPASEIMMNYFNELREWETYLESVRDNELGGGIYQEIGSEKRFWPKELLDGWLEDMDKAYKAVAHLELENPVLWRKYVKHIKIETLFPRYAICTLHEASYTSAEIRQLREEFKKDGDELGLVQHMEHGYITDMYKQWGLQ